MKALILSRFDPVYGAKIFLRTQNSISEEELMKVPPLMAVSSESFFIHIFESFKTVNLFFKLPSAHARGRIEKFLISIITDIDSVLNVNTVQEILENFTSDFINLEDAYKALAIESKGYKGEPEKIKEVENLFFSFFKTIKPGIEALEVTEYNLQERVKELTCLYELSKLIERSDLSVEIILQKILDIIPPAWQFPEITSVRIICDNKEYRTDNYRKTNWFLDYINEISEKTLSIQINYLDDKPFLKEEEELLSVIGSKLKILIEKNYAKQKLKKSEQRLKFLLSSNPAIIYSSKAYGDFGATFISDNIKAQTGYRPEDFIKDSEFWVKHVHPDDRERVLSGLSKLFEKGQHTHEYRFQIKDSSYLWMYDECKLITDEKGNPAEVVGYWSDITKRKKIKQELTQIFNLSLDMIGTVGFDGYFKHINPAFSKNLGYTTEELLAKPFTEFVHPEDIDSTLEEVGKLSDGVTTLKFENRYRCKDGSYRWLEWTANPIVEDQIMYTVAHDVSDRKKIEQELEQLFNATAPMYVIDKNYEILRVNNTYLSMFRLERENLIGKKCFDIWNGPLCHTPECSMKKILEGEEKYSYEIDKKLDNGTYITCIVTSYPYLSPDGDMIGCIKNFTDSTKRKEAEKKLKKN